jgi:hypothetical protein
MDFKNSRLANLALADSCGYQVRPVQRRIFASEPQHTVRPMFVASLILAILFAALV